MSSASIKPKLTIQQVKQLSRREFIELFADLFEHHPIIPQLVFDKHNTELQNLSSVQELHQLFDETLDYWLSLNSENGLQLIRAHPKLGASKLSSQRLSDNSLNEQTMTGLVDVSAQEVEEFNNLNDAYSNKFGFPFIVCVRAQGRKEAILNAFRTRLQNDNVDEEQRTALEQIRMIARIRLDDLVDNGMQNKL